LSSTSFFKSKNKSFKFLSAFFNFFNSPSYFFAFSFASFYSFNDFPFPPGDLTADAALFNPRLIEELPSSWGARIKWSGISFGSYFFIPSLVDEPETLKFAGGSGS
jgi:hypothetical protein